MPTERQITIYSKDLDKFLKMLFIPWLPLIQCSHIHCEGATSAENITKFENKGSIHVTAVKYFKSLRILMEWLSKLK